MSMIANLIRLEVVYKYGGFYIDTNYMFLKRNGLDDFLSYKFVISAYISMSHMGMIQNSFFGGMKNYKPILNMLNHKSLSSRNIYSSKSNI